MFVPDNVETVRMLDIDSRCTFGTVITLVSVLASASVVEAITPTPVEPGVSSEVTIASDCAADESLLLVVPAGASEVFDSVEFAAGESPVVYDFARLTDLASFADAVLALSCIGSDGAAVRSECSSVIFQPLGAVGSIEPRSCDGVTTVPIVATFVVTPVDVGVSSPGVSSPGVSSEVSIASECAADESVLVVAPVGGGVDAVVFGAGESPLVYDFARLPDLDARSDAVLASSCLTSAGIVSRTECFAAIFQPLGGVGTVERQSCDGVTAVPPVGRSVVTPVEASVSPEVRIWSNCAAGDVTALDVLTLEQDRVLDSVAFTAGEAVVTYDLAPLDLGTAEAFLAVECVTASGSLVSCFGLIVDFFPAGVVGSVIVATADCRDNVAPTTTTSPPTTVAPAGALPATGGGNGSMALLAAALLGLGSLAVRVSRRRAP